MALPILVSGGTGRLGGCVVYGVDRRYRGDRVVGISQAHAAGGSRAGRFRLPWTILRATQFHEAPAAGSSRDCAVVDGMDVYAIGARTRYEQEAWSLVMSI
jgi:hypothetical protein